MIHQGSRMENLRPLAIVSLLVAVLPLLLKAQDKESLLIDRGDLLHIQVFETPDLDEHARVTDGGDISLILGGDVKVSGLTPEGAAKVIEAALKQGHYLLHPRVIVNVEQYATENVTVIGSIKSPGVYPIGTPRSILDVLAMAGGLTETADRKILIERHGSGEKISYFVSNSAGAAVDTAVNVDPGDRVIVPRAGIVYALGDFGHPGGYVVDENNDKITILQLVARAGGTNPTAVPSHARLIRKVHDGYVQIPLQLSKIQKGKLPDVALQPEDIVYVPYSYLRNFAANSANIVATVGGAAIYRY